MFRPDPKPEPTPKKQPKPLKRTRIKKKIYSTGEGNVFKRIWETRPHFCINCKIFLGHVAKSFFFSHRKPKSTYPELRLDPENIDLLCFDCHRERDQGTIEKYNERKDMYT